MVMSGFRIHIDTKPTSIVSISSGAMKAAVVLSAVIAVAVGEHAAECLTCKNNQGLGDVLLQGRDTVTKTVMEDSGETLTNFIQIDGVNKVPVPRREIEGSFVRELLVKWELKDNPAISVTGDRARINFGQIFEGLFVRTVHKAPSEVQTSGDAVKGGEKELDFGVLKQMAWTSNSRKLGKLMFGEKSFTYYLPNGVSHASADKLAADHANQGAEQMAASHMLRQQRAYAANAVALGLSSQLTANTLDFAHFVTLKKYLAADRTPEQSVVDVMQKARLDMADFAKEAADSPIRSSLGCQHFEDFEGMEYDPNGTFVSIPLNTKMTAFRGRLASWPNEEYQGAAGLGVFTVTTNDKGEKALEMFVGYSSNADFVDTPEGFASMFSVGPVDGAAKPITPEGRPVNSDQGPMQAHFYGATQQIPRDYTYQTQNRESICPKEVLDAVPALSRTALGAMMAPAPNQTQFYSILNALTILGDCAVEYHRPVGQDTVNSAYDWPEAYGMMHMMAEIPGPYLVLAAKEDWNHISIL